MVLYRFVTKASRLNKRQVFIENKHYIDAYIDKTQSDSILKKINKMMDKHRTPIQQHEVQKMIIKKHLNDMMITNQDYVNGLDYDLMERIMNMINKK